MSPCIRNGAACHGGIIGYPLNELYEEVAFVAYHFHWNHDEITDMEHRDRRQWVKQISGINERMNEA